MRKFSKKTKHESIEDAIVSNLGRTEKVILSYLSDPSVREISRALDIPKSTVHRALLKLRAAGITTGKWTVGK